MMFLEAPTFVSRVSVQLLFAFLLLLSFSTISLKNAVVTGANRGIGLELCKQLCADDRCGNIFALCRKTSAGLEDLNTSQNKLNVLEGIDVIKEEATAKLQATFRSREANPIPIDLLVHNAGAYGPSEPDMSVEDMYSSQNLETITANRINYSFQLNAVAPLMVTQALLPNLRLAAQKETAKVIIISSLMGSITDNTSGKHYGYRAAKAAVNQIGKSLSVDLRDDKIAVGLVHPGFVYSGFGGEGQPRREGQRDVDVSVRGVLQAVDDITLDSTGCFLHGNYGEGVKALQW
jgi:tubulin alpha